MKSLRYWPGIQGQVQQLPPAARTKMRTALESLTKSKKGLDVKRLRGEFEHPLHRLKVGSWRAAFYESGNSIFVIRVFARRDGYDWLEQWEI